MTSNWSLRLPVIIVDDTSQDISATNRSSCVPYWPGYRKMLTNALVWASMVVVFSIFIENASKVVFIQDQDMVETLFPDRAHPPFSKRIRSGGLIRGVKDPSPF
jgi:hypothetical protein